MASAQDAFPVTGNALFFNHAAIAPLPLPAVEAMQDFQRECAERASGHWPAWQQRVAAVRRQAATLLGAAPEEIAFVGNTSSGLATIAEGFPWQAGDKLLYVTPDYPANVYPWLHLERRGVTALAVERREGRIDREMLAAALVPGVRLLALSSVDFASGACADLDAIGELCREKGVLLAVDAIQSLGIRALDVKRLGIHFLAAGGQKWLLGPLGTGLLYVDREWIPRLTPPLVGWKSVVDEEDFSLHFDLRHDAARFEPGSLNFSGIFGLGAALELLEGVGHATVEALVGQRVGEFLDGCRERGLRVLTPTDPVERAGILTFLPRREPAQVFRALLDAGVMLSLRGGGLRVSPHFYNSEEEVERFFALLDGCDR